MPFSGCYFPHLCVQAKSWQLNGNAIVASKYHHGAVECVLVTPLTAPPPSSRPASARPGPAAGGARGDAGGKVWTGSADGTVFCWPDPEGKGQINEAEGKSIKVEGGKGEFRFSWSQAHLCPFLATSLPSPV